MSGYNKQKETDGPIHWPLDPPPVNTIIKNVNSYSPAHIFPNYIFFYFLKSPIFRLVVVKIG